MTIDKNRLKALAEAATPGDEWYSVGDLRYADDKGGDIHGLHHDDDAFIVAASPASILALLGEIDRLERKNANQSESIRQYQDHLEGGDSILSLTNERDQLKAERDALQAQVSALQAEPQSWQSGYDAGRAAVKGYVDSWRNEVEHFKAENEALRKIISESATSSGTSVSVECSLDFMVMLLGEIRPIIDGLRLDAERYRHVRDCAYGAETIDGYQIMFEAPMPEGASASSAERLDMAVDADMKQEAGHD